MYASLLNLFSTFYFRHIFTAQMNIDYFLMLLSLSTAIGSPLLSFDDSASISDFTNFQLDPVSNVRIVVSSNNDPGLVEQTQPPAPGVSISQGTGPPITDSSLGTVQFQPSNFDVAGSTEKVGRAAKITTKTIYLCCESQGEEDEYVCDDRER